jgi:hypothetical protein
MTTTYTLHPEILALYPDGWYQAKIRRNAGEVFCLGGHPVAVLAIRTERELVGGPDDRDSDGEYTTLWLRLRDATAEELAIANASREAVKAGHGPDHPARRANEAQKARIVGEYQRA